MRYATSVSGNRFSDLSKRASSLAAADLLASRGCEDVRVLDEGLSAWRPAGRPTEPVSRPIRG